MKLTKPSGNTVLGLVKDNLLWIIGCAIYSLSVNVFALPNNIAQSGVSGLAIVCHRLFGGLSLGTYNFLLNLPLLILAFIFIGRAFVGKTLWVIVLLSAALDLFGEIIPIPAYQGDRILAALFSGILSGIGLSLVLRTGATSGGTDIVGRLIHARWPHISVGSVIFAFDAAVVVLSAVVFRSVESALYAVIVIFISTKVIDTVLYGMGNGKMIMVITDRGEEMSSAIVSRCTRGVTVLPAKGAYTGEDKSMLICVVRANEVQKIDKIIHEIDERSFMIVSEANEILGKGFGKTI